MARYTGVLPGTGGVYTAEVGTSRRQDGIGVVGGSPSILALLDEWDGRELPRPALIAMDPVTLDVDDPESVAHALFALTTVTEAVGAPDLYDSSEAPEGAVY